MHKKYFLIFLGIITIFTAPALSAAAQNTATSAEAYEIREGINFFPQPNILCLAAYNNMVFWGTDQGLFGYDQGSGELTQFTDRKVPYILNQEDLWAVESPARLYRYHTNRRIWQPIDPPAALRGREIRGLARTDNYLWVGSNALPEGRNGIVLWRYAIAQASWENMSLLEMESRTSAGITLPDHDFANTIRAFETGLLIFGEFRTYLYAPETGDWEEITSGAERQEAVRTAFYSQVQPFSIRVYYGSNLSIFSLSGLWRDALHLPSSSSAGISAVVQDDQATWLATDSGLLRSDNSARNWGTITPALVKVYDVLRAGDYIWAGLAQQGVLQLSLDLDWSRFLPLTLSDISPPATEIEVEGLISIEESYPNKELSLIEHWQERKRNYYVITGDFSEEMHRYIGKIVKVSGRSTLLRRFAWGGKYYRLEVMNIIEVREQQ